jgi:hypothetical protein
MKCTEFEALRISSDTKNIKLAVSVIKLAVKPVSILKPPLQSHALVAAGASAYVLWIFR